MNRHAAAPAPERLWPRAAQTGASTGQSNARDMRDTHGMHDTSGPYDTLVQTCATLRAHAETISNEVSARYSSAPV